MLRRSFSFISPFININKQFCVNNNPVSKYQLIWFCKPGHEKLLCEEIKLNTNGTVNFHVDNGWIKVKQTSDINPFAEPVWGRVCMHNFKTFSSKKSSELLDKAENFFTLALKEMMEETTPYSKWNLHSYEAGMNSHQGLVSSFDKKLRKRLLNNPKLKGNFHKKGTLEVGDMMVQMFMPKSDTLYVSAGYVEIDPLGREQPLHWLGGHFKAKHLKNGPSKADTKIIEAFAHYDIEDDQIEDSIILELGGAPGGWTSYLLEKGASVTSVDLADSNIKHKNFTYIKGDAKDVIDNFKDGVDWLIADLSMQPNKSVELLSTYLKYNIPNRFIWSIKFGYHENENWNEVIQNIRKMFAVTHLDYNFRIRHLYYQKREIMIWGHKVEITKEYYNNQEEYTPDSEIDNKEIEVEINETQLQELQKE